MQCTTPVADDSASSRLGVQRLRTLQEKKGAQAKAARRDIALLLEKGKLETARIKVENSELPIRFQDDSTGHSDAEPCLSNHWQSFTRTFSWNSSSSSSSIANCSYQGLASLIRSRQLHLPMTRGIALTNGISLVQQHLIQAW